MKKCSYCGRDNDDIAAYCAGCGTDNFKTEGLAAEPEEQLQRTEPFKPRVLSEEERRQAFVTIRSCRSTEEADLLLMHLKSADIDAFLPDETLMTTLAWNTNAYGFVRVNVPTEQYDRAVDLLVNDDAQASQAPEPEPWDAEIKSTMPLSWPMRLLMVLLPIGFCPMLIIAAFICESYRKKGYKRRAEEAYLLLLISTAFGVVLGLLLWPLRR